MRAAATSALVLAATACASSAAPPPCETSLEGVWRSGVTVDGEAIGYHFLERGHAIEGYPTFRDVPDALPAGVRAAPAAIDLTRAKGLLGGGRWSRRYELAGQRCVVSAPVKVRRCAGRDLVLELGPLAPPTDWTACPPPADLAAMRVAPMTSPSRVLALHR